MIELLIFLIVLGAALYILQLLPIDGRIKQIIQVVAIVVAVVYLIRLVL